ncbi:MAG TPA: succinate dehydrogenase assembly factor 2 [Burkholderiales bacterium]|nr:succinate dehydrogenase assembly factor 2 [Burkholderiales bacterium]
MADVGRSTQTGAQELNRLRWQCRRGVFELDLVLEKHCDRLQCERLVRSRCF